MQIHNVTAEYVRQLRDLGFGNVGSDKLIAMRIHGVSVDFVRELKSLGFDPSTD